MTNAEKTPPSQEEDIFIPETGAPDAPIDPIFALEAEKAEIKDRLLRTLADMENLRRRTEREVSESRVYGITNFARDVLTVADNLRRALDAMPVEAKNAAEGAIKALVEGVELTERDLLKTLERHGVKKREPMGEKFNPNLDQAMFELPDDTKPSGTIVQVIQPGYVIGERVLRNSLVGVSKGGPKSGNTPAS